MDERDFRTKIVAEVASSGRRGTEHPHHDVQSHSYGRLYVERGMLVIVGRLSSDGGNLEEITRVPLAG